MGAGLLVKMRGKWRILVAKLMKRQTNFNNFHTIAPVLCGPVVSDTIRYVFLGSLSNNSTISTIQDTLLWKFRTADFVHYFVVTIEIHMYVSFFSAFNVY